MKHLLLFTVVSTILLISCSKKDAQQVPQQYSQENILDSNAHVIDTSAIIRSDSMSVTLKTNSLNFKPKVGDILLASPSLKNKLGLLVQITAIDTLTGNNTLYHTKLADLNAAFRQLFINYTYNQDFQSSATYSRGISLGNIFNHLNFGTGLELNGNIELHFPETKIKYVKRDGSHLPDTVSVVAFFNTEGSNLELSGNAINLSEITLPVKFPPLPPILVPVPIGLGVVYIPFTQKIKLQTLPASVSGKMKFQVFPIVHATLGFSYERGSWKNLSTFSIDATAKDLKDKKKDFDASLEASLTFITPVYEIAPLGIERFKGYFKVPNKLELTIQDPSPNYKLIYKMNVEAGVNYKFWTGFEGNLSASATLLDPTILEGNFTYKIGDTAFGGIIFYLDATRKHGLVCAPGDQSINNAVLFSEKAPVLSCGETFSTDAYWNCFFTNSNPSTCIDTRDSRLGSGAAKTDSIALIFGPATPNVAQLCKLYLGGGYTDWFLPSTAELEKLYLNKDSSTAFPKTGKYFSSTVGCNYGCGAPPYTSTMMFIDGKDFSTGGQPNSTWGSFLYYEEAATPWSGHRPWVEYYDSQIAKVRAIRKF